MFYVTQRGRAVVEAIGSGFDDALQKVIEKLTGKASNIELTSKTVASDAAGTKMC